MTSALITVCPLDAMEELVVKTSASHLVSLINEQMMPSTPHSLEPGHHLKLSMNDIEEPVSGLVPPSNHHICQLLDFVQKWDRSTSLVIHCWAGISRSTAAAFIALCALNPETSEMQIARLIRERSPTATPNSLLVTCADQLLERSGRMVCAIDEIGRGSIASTGTPFSMPACIDKGRL